MNLFVVGWCGAGASLDVERPRAALAGLLERTGLLEPASIEHWRAPSGTLVLAWACHPPEQAGAARYVHLERERLALFCGRPLLWRDNDVAGGCDGRAPLDARLYLDAVERWAPALDGRWAALRYEDSTRRLEVLTDALGAYPLYRRDDGAVRWLSNSAAALADLGEGSQPALAVAASLLGGGWSLSGDPLALAVRRVPSGRLLRLEPAGSGAVRESLGVELALPARLAATIGAGFDVARAAERLVVSLRALADWPGRPSLVPVTGGRDSRLVLAAALRAGIEFSACTAGPPDHPDVRVARQLCAAVGIAHEPVPYDPHGALTSHWRKAAGLLADTAAGTTSLEDAAGFPLGPRSGPLPLWHSGQGGEIARGYYGDGAGLGAAGLSELLYRRFVGRRPGRVELLSPTGAALVREQIASWVDAQLALGFGAADVPDLFYLWRRMGTWAAPAIGCVEPVRDTTAPLWSSRLLEDELGLPVAERACERFHRRLIEHLEPALVAPPFADGGDWRDAEASTAQARRRARALGDKALAELGRRRHASTRLQRLSSRPQRPSPRLLWPRGGGLGPSTESRRPRAWWLRPPGRVEKAGDPLAPMLADLGAAVAAQPEHWAWEVLDRDRVARLLERDPAGLDAMSRAYAWRLATVFFGFPVS